MQRRAEKFLQITYVSNLLNKYLSNCRHQSSSPASTFYISNIKSFNFTTLKQIQNYITIYLRENGDFQAKEHQEYFDVSMASPWSHFSIPRASQKAFQEKLFHILLFHPCKSLFCQANDFSKGITLYSAGGISPPFVAGPSSPLPHHQRAAAASHEHPQERIWHG